MKYMGSKRTMLQNGLGKAIALVAPSSRRFIDLFTGSASVAWHVAQHFDVPVHASDLQSFAVTLAKAVVLRNIAMPKAVFDNWLQRATSHAQARDIFKSANEFQIALRNSDILAGAAVARGICGESHFVVTSAYGGYYFSPLQAIWLDAFRSTLPKNQLEKNVCLAALIWAASRSAASPGHTAQPFKPNATAGRYLRDAWSKDVKGMVESSFETIAALYARQVGDGLVGDANLVAGTLQEGDLAFIDPPYSSVHYSRFYHVLETLTLYNDFRASGEGRYPPPEARPLSLYSQRKNALTSLQSLFKTISLAGASAIVTFPAGDASNGICGEDVSDAAADFFDIESATVSGKFSTLGGNRKHRLARVNSEELILTLSRKGRGAARVRAIGSLSDAANPHMGTAKKVAHEHSPDSSNVKEVQLAPKLLSH